MHVLVCCSCAGNAVRLLTACSVVRSHLRLELSYLNVVMIGLPLLARLNHETCDFSLEFIHQALGMS